MDIALIGAATSQYFPTTHMKARTLIPIALLSVITSTMVSCTTEVHEHVVTPVPTVQSQTTTTESVRSSGSIYTPARTTTTETTTIR
jgi:hypothetical protein